MFFSSGSGRSRHDGSAGVSCGSSSGQSVLDHPLRDVGHGAQVQMTGTGLAGLAAAAGGGGGGLHDDPDPRPRQPASSNSAATANCLPAATATTTTTDPTTASTIATTASIGADHFADLVHNSHFAPRDRTTSRTTTNRLVERCSRSGRWSRRIGFSSTDGLRGEETTTKEVTINNIAVDGDGRYFLNATATD